MLLDAAPSSTMPPGARARVVDRQGQEIELAPLTPLLSRLVERYRPEQIWLFGSRARGDATADSDWDLLVALPDDADDQEFDPVWPWRLRRELKIRADIVLCTMRDVSEDFSTPNTLFFEVAKEGVRIYER